MALALFAGVVLSNGSTTLAATITVTSDADAGGPCPGAATCTLRQAINDAASGDAIDFAAGVTTITLTSDELLINKNLTVNGPGASGLTVQRSTAQNTPDFRIFDIAANTTVTISGLTITAGSAPQNGANNAGTATGNTGGGIFNASTLTIADSVVTNNQTSLSQGMGYGGGIFNNGSLTITNSAITNNQTSPSESAGFGGGIANSGSLLIKGSTLSGNKVGDNPTAAYFSSPTGGGGGGAIYSSSGNVTIVNSTLSGNRAGKGATSTNSFNGDGGDGGAIYYRGSTLIIVNSTVSGNRAGDGGGSGAQMGNAGLGGGIVNIGTATIMNCTITANQAGDGAVAISDYGSGGGIFNNGTLTILGNIIAGNSTVAVGAVGPDIRGGGSGNVKSDGYNLIQDPSGATITPNPNAGPDMTGVDPRLGPLGDNGGPTQTHLLLPGSPAIDAGNPSALPPDTYDLNNNGNTSEPLPVDQRGFARLVNSKFDIGAIEVSYSISATAGTPQSTAIYSAFPTNLQATAEESNMARSGLTVTFTAPSSGPSGTFPGGSTTATATTDSNGIATAPTFIANNIVGGPYTVSATIGTGLPTAEFSLTNTPVPTPAQALNISTRLMVQTGDKVMIGGFIVTGNASKPVVLRGLGPSLVNSGMPPVEVLNDPVLELHGPDGALITANDNWKDSPQRSQIEGTVYQPTDDRESVIVATLSPGNYTAILTGKNQTTGVGLVEVYDHDTTVDSSLANMSTRGFVQTADNVMIGGFMLGNNPANARIAVRGIGPSLTSFGLSNVLADPTLDLHDANGTIMVSNDNWTDDPVSAAQLTANGLALKDPRESGIFMSLPPGGFTAVLAGKNGGVGIGLVEIYNLQ
jgi:CSLREA domain-containing protein